MEAPAPFQLGWVPDVLPVTQATVSQIPGLHGYASFGFGDDPDPDALPLSVFATSKPIRTGCRRVTTLADLEQEAGKSYLAVADMSGNVLILEAFSAVGFERREVLSRGAAVASHFMTVNRDTRLAYVRDGVTALDFEPFCADFRDVADAELATAMQEAGFLGPQGVRRVTDPPSATPRWPSPSQTV